MSNDLTLQFSACGLCSVCVNAVMTTEDEHTRLKKQLFQDDITTIPLRNANDTLMVYLSLSLLKIILLVRT